MSPQTPDGALVASDLSVSVDGREIVRGLNLLLHPGRAVAIIGLSGAGKSTIARTLVGLSRAQGGSLRYQGRELVGAPRSAWRGLRERLQLCWQDPLRALDPRLSARASINEARLLNKKPAWPASSDQLLALAEELGLGRASLERRPTALSGGQRQRVALARALACDPALLIADEITSALDRPLAVDIIRRLAARVRSGLGVLLITHDLSLLCGWIDEALVLDEGRIVERGAPEQLLGDPKHGTTRRLRDALPRLPTWPSDKNPANR